MQTVFFAGAEPQCNCMNLDFFINHLRFMVLYKPNVHKSQKYARIYKKLLFLRHIFASNTVTDELI
jgi:hypothetical protein